MHFSRFLIVLSFFCLFAYPLYAAGNFYIGEDAGGVYFQTDNHGGWYIAEQDLKAFKIGETGRYAIRTDRNGTYVKTEKHGKFYLDLEAIKQLENEIVSFNREQEKKREKLQVEETQRKELEKKGNDETPQDNTQVRELKVTVSHEYRYPYAIWSGPYRYGRYGKPIHHKIRSPK